MPKRRKAHATDPHPKTGILPERLYQNRRRRAAGDDRHRNKRTLINQAIDLIDERSLVLVVNQLRKNIAVNVAVLLFEVGTVRTTRAECNIGKGNLCTADRIYFKKFTVNVEIILN